MPGERAAAADGPAAEGPAGQQLRGLARGGLGNLAGAGVAAVGGVGVVLVVARTLPLQAAGVFLAGTSVFLIAATVAKLGTTTGLIYVISGARAQGRRGGERAVLRLALGPALATSVGIALVLVLAAPALAGRLGLDGSGGVAVLRVLALLLPAAVLSDSVLAASRGLNTMRPTVLIESLGRTLLQLVLVIVTALATRSAAAVALAWSAPYLASAAAAWLKFRSLTARADPDAPAPDRAAFWAFTWPRAVSSVVQIALQRLDVVLVAAMLGPGKAAVYAAASRFLVVGQLASGAVANAAQPRLRMALARGDVAGAQHMYRTATGWLILLNWPLYLLAMVFAEPMLRIFGHGYVEGDTVVLVLGAAMLVATACGMVDMVLNMGGRSSWNLYNNLAALTANVVVDLLLIPHIGILGAAVGWAVAILVNNLVPLTQIALVLRIHPVTRGTATAVLLAAACFAGCPLLGSALAGGRVAGAAAGAVVGLVLYVAGCRLLAGDLALTALAAALRRRPARRGRHRPGALAEQWTISESVTEVRDRSTT